MLCSGGRKCCFSAGCHARLMLAAAVDFSRAAFQCKLAWLSASPIAKGETNMARGNLMRGSSVAVGMLLVFVGTAFGDESSAAKSTAKPLVSLLDRFTAPDVPVKGPAEEEVAARKGDQPIPTGLPGKGLAEHPMLYIGEGYNKMFLVKDGKVAWTYSTGKGNEYDDVWMLSNGNILFSRMQYVAEITPKKDVVWRYDAPEKTEIHACQPIGLDKVLLIENGLPPKLKVINIKSGVTEVEHNLPALEPPDPKNGSSAIPARPVHCPGYLFGAIP